MKKLHFPLAFLLTLVLSIGQAWAANVTYELTISPDDFNTTSYVANNNEKTSDAICTSDPSKTYIVKWTSNQVMKNSGVMQWQKNASYIFNSTDLGTINSVTVNSTDGTFTTYYGTAEHPTSGTTVGNGFFTVCNGNATGKTSSVVVTFTVVEGGGESEPIAVTGVELDESAISLEVGQTQQLKATVLPVGATEKTVSWSSDDESIATVDANGNVTAVAAGSATITVTTTDGGKTATCTVEVIPATPKSKLIFEAACGGSGTADDGAVWTVTSDGAESVYDATSGIHYGTGSANVTYLQLSTSDISGTIKKVIVNARDAQGKATISVTVGGEAFTCSGSTTPSNTSADFEFTGSKSGEIVVRIDRGSSMAKAIYCKSVIVCYESGEGGEGGEEGGDDPVVESAYYLAGSMNSWAPAEAYKFAANPSQDGEFVLNTTLEVGDEFKVARSDNGTSFADDAWYPQGMNNNFVVTEDYAGEKTIYFRPAGNEAWDQLEGYIYVAANEVPVEEEILTCAKAAELALAGNTDQVTVKGYVTGIVEEWSGYKNISFWMADTKDGGQVFEAFRVVCENEADAPGVGDLVKVTGTLTKYTKNGVTIAETTAGGSFEILEKAETGGEEQPTDPVELTCAAAAEAALSVSTDNEAYNSGAKYFVRGYVTGIKTAWSNNKMTFWVADAKDGGEVLQVYNCAILSEEEAVTIGDYVQVTGKLTKFKSTPQFVAGSVCEILEKSVPAVNLGATSIAEFLEMKNSKDTCILTGVVANIVMSGEEYNVYGNFDLVDENDADIKVFIYGLLTADGQSKKFREMGIDAGDLLTLKAIYSEHNGEPQVANAIFVSVVKNETTGISNAAVEVKAQKVIRDGQLYIMRNGVLYNANGAVVK